MEQANITWLTDQIATGGDFSFNPDVAQKQFEELLGMDIDLIIDCRMEAEDSDVWDTTHIDYLHLPTNDASGWHIPSEHFDKAVEQSLSVIEGGGKVFIHCHMGVNRGPSTAFAVLLATGMAAERAFNLIRQKRPIAAVYYAQDALIAHLKRKNVHPLKAAKKVDEFSEHFSRVMDAKTMSKVNHTIRQLHKKDEADLLASR